MTLKVHILLRLAVSVAVWVTIVLPAMKNEPDVWDLLVLILPSTISLAVIDDQLTAAVLLLTLALATISSVGQSLNTGAWLSTTVTVNVHVAVLPLVSTALYVTIVSPVLNACPVV